MRATRRRRLPPSIVVQRSWFDALPGALLALGAIVVVVNSFLASGGATPPTPPMPLAADAVNDWHRFHNRDYIVCEVTGPTSILVTEPDAPSETLPVRLLGLTPFVDEASTTEADRDARTFLADLIEGGQIHLVLSPQQTRDDADRLLAYAFLERGGRMVNEMMLEGGWAQADRQTPHPYQTQFAWLQRRAQKDGLGRWANGTP